MLYGDYPDSGLDILIVGAGLAGLTAAIECVRKGHRVRVLERGADINTMGDMYFMGLSGTKFFKHWPAMKAEYDEISMQSCFLETFKHDGELMIPAMKVSERLRAIGLDPNTPPGAFQMRPLVYKMFINQAERLEIPFLFNKRVTRYFEHENKAGVETDEGEKFEADVVIAADGIGSKSQTIVGGKVRAASSGRAMWRAVFPAEVLDKDPEVREFFSMKGEDPIVRTFLGPGTYGLTLNREGTVVWIINHDATGTEKESWSHTVSSESVLENMDKSLTSSTAPEWAPILKKLIALTPPDTIVNFELFWRNPQPMWHSPGARVVQIGDCAHSFLPSSGNGATQAIEDAVSLASCLELGVKLDGKSAVPDAVRSHVRLRFLRCACAQKLGFSNAERLQDTDWNKVKIDPKKAQPKHPKWVWAHDPEEYVYDNYEKCLKGMRAGVPLDQDPNIPPNYPPGYKWEPWNIDEIMRDLEAGVAVELGSGNWD
ncbi:monooxygenase [Paraphaeosphaeria sporulosa]|uniref:Monooxygenase n=1 Tax=Paraphaeosphaeria sporulosa TaxID=1460663 RepID=A0A177C5V8_9PLEO|nr:monooxygenase [Paraphaeosphaeria sporulosa]OAG02158.1 monooxygenase [Paraphaeosphaeria sporulosa]